MADVITFVPAAEGGTVREFVLSSASSPDGPFSVVATATAEVRSFTVPVTEPALCYYTVSAEGASGTTACSAPVGNGHVSLGAEVGAAGATLRSSNGEVMLTLAPGSFVETTTVTIEEIDGTPVGSIISLAGVYDISASTPLAVPARLSVAYRLAVTHHQVSATLLKAAGLMTYDGDSGDWISAASDVSADADYLSGTLSHFSYWTGGTIQPHGTSGTAVSYCSGICHDLTTAPGSSTRYATRDAQVCYNCHGSGNLLGPPVGAPADTENVEASIRGGAIMSRHPVAAGDLYCTACHDPHASPASSPGLLRAWDPTTGKYLQGGAGVAPGNELCWTCHGPVKNRRVEALVTDYYANTGGDKKSAYEQSAHGTVAPINYSWVTTTELLRGTVGWGLFVSEPGRLAFDSGYQLSGTSSWTSNYLVPGVSRLDSNALTWMEVAPAGTSVSFDANVSLDGGITWLGWQPVTNGGSLPHITPTTDLRQMRLVIRANLHRDGTTGGPYVWNIRWSAMPGAVGYQPSSYKVKEFVGQGEFDLGTYRLSRYYPTYGGVLADTNVWNVATGANASSPTPVLSGSVSQLPDAPAAGQTVLFGNLAPTGSVITAVVDMKLDDVYVLSSVYIYSGYPTGYGSVCPEQARVETSLDGITYTPVGVGGGLNAPRSTMSFMVTERPARYVRVFIEKYTLSYPVSSIGLSRIELGGRPVSGTYSWLSPPVTVTSPREVTVEWYAPPEPEGTVLPAVALSTDGGTTWSDFRAIEFGKPLPFGELSGYSSVQIKTRFVVSLPEIYYRTSLRDVIIWNSHDAGWSPPPADDFSCSRCHQSHGSTTTGLTKAPWAELCWSCHPSGGTSWKGEAGFQASAHGAQGCRGCHDAHGTLNPATGKVYPGMLVNTQAQVCFRCHDNPANSKNGVNIEDRFTKNATTDESNPYTRPVWVMRHNVEEWEQEYLGSNLDCSDCHGVHSVTGERTLLDPQDPTREFTQTIDVPRIVRVPVIADASIVSGSTTPLGTTGSIPISANTRILMRFDLSQIPAGAQIVDATLVLWRPVMGNQVTSVSELKPVGLYRVTESWDEATVLWDNRGGGLGAWSTPGATTTGTRYSTMAWGAHRIDATALLADLMAGPDYGVLVQAEDAAVSWAGGATVYERPSHEGNSGPYLEVRYHPAEGPDQGLDSIAYCTSCHGSHLPPGMSGGFRRPGYTTTVLKDVLSTWGTSMHGGGNTTVPGPTSHTYRTGALMRPPYRYGQAEAIQCTVCHDPHGSNNVWHLRDTPVLDSFSSAGGVDWLHNQFGGWYMGYWCGQCHIGTDHQMNYNGSCTACHYHGRGGLRF